MMAQKLLVVAGPSGAGKGTLVASLIKKYPNAFRFSVSSTSRDPRKGEVEGREYFFVDKDTFKSMIDKKQFLESAYVHGNYYGTSLSQVENVRSLGKICLLEIDLQGVKQVKTSLYGEEANYVFITPPDLETLETRLRGRGTESEDILRLRLTNAANEMKESKEMEFNYILYNGDLGKAFDELDEFVQSNYPHLRKMVEGGEEEKQGEKANKKQLTVNER